MRTSTWTPSIVPRGDDDTVYQDNLGRLGAVRPTLKPRIVDRRLFDSQYKDPIRVIAFNTAEH